MEVVTEAKRQLMFEHFFNITKIWISYNDSSWDGYQDIDIYYLFDEDKYVKVHPSKHQPQERCILIEHNRDKMKYLMRALNIMNKDEITLQGRIIAGNKVKDDLFFKFMTFVNITFNKFFHQNFKTRLPYEPYKQDPLF